ncbi:MAG: VOC family protein [Thaumarchaeota archaeon]|nr:VOC family protein [Nitrososphaerota archaeon]
MATKPVPEGFHTLTPYLHVRGAAGLIDFLKRAFGAEEMDRMSKSDGTIAHAQVKIGNSMLELSDAHDKWQPMPCAIHLYVNNVDGVYKQAVGVGAESLYEPVDQDYGDREAGVRDPCGNVWYIATHVRDT